LFGSKKKPIAPLFNYPALAMEENIAEQLISMTCLVLCQVKEHNGMWFFFLISALKILAVATAMAAFFALILEKITAIII
jgi:hypothetical protein